MQRAQAPCTPPRPSTAGLYRLCLAQRPSNFLDRTFKTHSHWQKRTPTARWRQIEDLLYPAVEAGGAVQSERMASAARVRWAKLRVTAVSVAAVLILAMLFFELFGG